MKDYLSPRLLLLLCALAVQGCSIKTNRTPGAAGSGAAPSTQTGINSDGTGSDDQAAGDATSDDGSSSTSTDSGDTSDSGDDGDTQGGDDQGDGDGGGTDSSSDSDGGSDSSDSSDSTDSGSAGDGGDDDGSSDGSVPVDCNGSPDELQCAFDHYEIVTISAYDTDVFPGQIEAKIPVILSVDADQGKSFWFYTQDVTFNGTFSEHYLSSVEINEFNSGDVASLNDTGKFTFDPEPFSIDLMGIHRIAFAFIKDQKIYVSNFSRAKFMGSFYLFLDEEFFTQSVKDERYGFALAGDDKWLAVSSLQADDGISLNSGTGKVDLYRYNSNTKDYDHVDTASVTSQSNDMKDDFGYSLAIDSNRIAIGCRKNLDPHGHGRVYIYDIQSNGDLKNKTFVKTSGNYQDQFGAAVDLDGQYLVVGAPATAINESGLSTNSGAVFLYRRVSGTWQIQDRVTSDEISGPCGQTKATSECSNNQLGTSVVIKGDRVFVGSLRGGSTGSTDRGAVYEFRIESNKLVEKARISIPNGVLDMFGTSIDFDPVHERLVVGAPNAWENENEPRVGRAYVLETIADTWVVTTTFPKSDYEIGDFLDGGSEGDLVGQSVSINDKFIAVGAPGTDKVLIYEYANYYNDWFYMRTHQPSYIGSSGGNYGFSTMISDQDEILVGDPLHSPQWPDEINFGRVERFLLKDWTAE